MIFGGLRKEHDFKGLANELSKRGTLSIYEDRDETYYLFDEDQDINSIRKEFSFLKSYD